MRSRVARRLLGLVAAASGLSAPAAAEEVLLDGIAAQVGNDVVLVSEVTQITSPMEARLREAGAPSSEIERVRAQVLDRLVERRLLEQLVRRVEIDASEPEIDAAIARIAEANGLTLEELRQSVEAQGLDYASYRDQIRGEIQRTKVLNGVIGAQVHVEEKDLRALYAERFDDQPDAGEEVHLRHIVVSFRGTEAADVAAARETADAALARIRAGEPFAAVASEVSDASPATGGDVGWVHVDALASWMAPTVRALAPGETSDLLRTRFGYNLLHLVDRRTFRKPDFEEVEDALYQEAYSRQLEAKYEEWIEKLRAQTYIEIKETIAAAPAPRSRPSGEPEDAAATGGP
ncbi:MAG: peptidylprolyl isomerase [Deltaproteobacteria bacterium]|nr:MAG: peptidylprolyl isomerase [Deltaproteobacteria bacterium]